MAYNYEWPYTDPEQYNDDWLLTKMKQLAAEWDQMKVKFTTLEEYVKNYFANLNLQDEVNKKIDAMIADGTFQQLFKARKYIFIGSSYGTTTYSGGWILGVAQKLNLIENVDYYQSAVGGAGCASGVTFATQIDTLSAKIPQSDVGRITDIVIVGSINDWDKTILQIADGLNQIVTSASRFPNASISYILGEWSFENDTIRQKTLEIYTFINQYANKIKVFNGVYRIFFNSSYLELDMVHPGVIGMFKLSSAIVNIIQGGDSYQDDTFELRSRFELITGTLLPFEGGHSGDLMHIRQDVDVTMTFLSPINITHTPVIIGTCSYIGNNQIFSRKWEHMMTLLTGFENGEFRPCLYKLIVERENNVYNLKIASYDWNASLNDYTLENVRNLKLIFEATAYCTNI